MKKSAGFTLFLFLMLTAIAVSTCGKRDPSNDREPRVKRIVLLTVDTLRADRLHCYGYERETSPNIDRLAAGGALFEHAQVPRGSTYPSLTTILTGKYPVTHGVRRNAGFLSDEHLILPEIFRDEGFGTAGFFTNMLNAPNRGFDTRKPYFPGKKTAAEIDRNATSDAITWIEEHKDGPFFAWLHLYDPHKPYAPEPEFNRFVDPNFTFEIPDDYERREKKGRLVHAEQTELDIYLQYVMGRSVELPPEQVAHVNALYDGEILAMDSQVGRVLDALERLEIADETLLVFTSDHGEELYDRNQYFYHAASVYQGVLHVPLIVRLPRDIRGAQRFDDLVEAVDVAPTLFDLAGMKDPDEGFEGESLGPLLRGDGTREHKAAFAEWGERAESHPDQDSIYTIRKGDWKLIYNPDNIHPDLNPFKLYETSYPIGKEELYNLADDPLERRNLVGEEPERADALRAELKNFIKVKEAAGSTAPVTFDGIIQLVLQGYATVDEARKAAIRLGHTGEEFDERIRKATEK